jgi:hypothetical protein
VLQPEQQPTDVVARRAHELADDRRRQRQREPGDEVRRRPGGDHPVDERLGDHPDPRSEALDRAGGELPRDEPAQPGVLRRVHVQHDVGQLVARQQERHLGLVGVGAAEPGVRVDPPDVLVAAHEVCLAARCEPHLQHRRPGAHLGDLLGRVDGVGDVEGEDRWVGVRGLRNLSLGHDCPHVGLVSECPT